MTTDPARRAQDDHQPAAPLEEVRRLSEEVCAVGRRTGVAWEHLNRVDTHRATGLMLR